MGPSIFSRPPVPETELASGATDSKTAKPFRLLDLPKEIRFMIYEKLPIITQRHDTPLRNRDHYLTLVTTTIPGISILATCRQVNEEASHVLAPHLQNILQTPPTVIVEAQHLVGLIDLHDALCLPQSSILDRVVSSLSGYRIERALHKYRRGKKSLQDVRGILELNNLVDSNDEATLKAIIRFVLRAAKYMQTKPDTIYKHAPLTVVIAVPTSFQYHLVTTSTSRMRNFYYKFFSTRRRPRRPRTQRGLATLSWLLRRFAFHAALTCRIWRAVSLSVKFMCGVHGRREAVAARVLAQSEHAFQFALMRGVADAELMGKGLVYYGGLARGKEI
ncbi:hypothetical protein BDW02DRAFT_557375 [Decorospora gaudefroyi]|uniref:F-box domain-containing protein n=1 Tax=Decorospora gaudefroyi TaxID=184978 RepID=A0A6A5K362_9PLEO|nr:hypothetical protein BDW02DRAFT_557375 [Decorospora gaudefroyi]